MSKGKQRGWNVSATMAIDREDSQSKAWPHLTHRNRSKSSVPTPAYKIGHGIRRARGDLVRKPITITPEPPKKPELKMFLKKQPWFVFRCGFPLKRGRKCKHKDQGAQRGPLEFRAQQHWNKHVREQQQQEQAKK